MSGDERGRLEYAAIALSIVALVLVLVFLVAPLARVQAPYMEATISAAYTSMSPPAALDAPPLDSIVFLSRLLAAATIITGAGLVVYLRWWLGRHVLAALGFLFAVELVLAHGLLRTLLGDVLPVIGRAQIIAGSYWKFTFAKPTIETTLIAGYYNLLFPAAIIVFIVSALLLLTSQPSKTKIAAVGVLLLLVLASPVQASVFAGSTLTGTAVVGDPVIWYGDPGVPGSTVVLGPYAASALVNTSIWNIALVVADYNASAGVVAQRSFAENVDYVGDPYRFNFTWRVLGYRILDDPYGVGIILGEAYMEWSTAAGSAYAWVSAYVSPNNNDTIIIGYEVVDPAGIRSGTCAEVNRSEWNITFTVYGDLLNDNYTVYVDGGLVCELAGVIGASYLDVTLVSFIVGRYDWTNQYEIYVDDIHLTVETSSGTIGQVESFQDGIDDVFSPLHGDYWWLDTYYTYPAGSSPTPPPDGSVTLIPQAVRAATLLDILSSLEDGTSIPGWTELARAECARNGTFRTVGIRVDETGGVARALAWVNLSLNGSNFQDWDLLAPDGSNIYFTLPDGTVTLHHVELIDVAAKQAFIQVLVPSLPAYSSAHVYMHYGGTSPYNTTVSFTPETVDNVRVAITGPIAPLLVENLQGVNGNWTVNDTLILNGSIVQGASSAAWLQVLAASQPNLSRVILFAAAPPGSDTSCSQEAWNMFLPSGLEAVRNGINHTVNLAGGILASTLSKSGLGLVAGRSGTGLDTDPDYIHWVYLNLTTGLWQFRYVSGTIVRNASGQATVLETNFLDLSSLTWSERYALGPFVVFVNPYRASQDYSFTIRDINGVDHPFTMTALVDTPDQVSLDIAIAWEDLWWPGTAASLDNFIDHVVRLTIFTNGTARVEILYASGGYLHMFMLNSQLPPFDTVPNIVEKYVTNNYTLDPEDSVIYVKPHGALVTETSGQVWDPVTGTYKNPPLIFYVEIR